MSFQKPSLHTLARRTKQKLKNAYHHVFYTRVFSHKVPKYIAVTIGIGPTYSFMARHAADSCMWATGLPTFVVGEGALKKYPEIKCSNRIKFHLFDLFPEADSILYFDSDTLFLKPWDVARFKNSPIFYCVKDQENKWSRADASAIGIPLDQYFNSGFFIACRKFHLPLFELAHNLFCKNYPTTLLDQGYLNRARFDLNISTEFLPREYNSVAYENGEDEDRPTVAHLNGTGALKLVMVKERYRVLKAPALRYKSTRFDRKHRAYRLI